MSCLFTICNPSNFFKIFFAFRSLSISLLLTVHLFSFFFFFCAKRQIHSAQRTTFHDNVALYFSEMFKVTTVQRIALLNTGNVSFFYFFLIFL
jgi:hypothetical protein